MANPIGTQVTVSWPGYESSARHYVVENLIVNPDGVYEPAPPGIEPTVVSVWRESSTQLVLIDGVLRQMVQLECSPGGIPTELVTPV